MTAQLLAFTIDATRPRGLAGFWAEVFGWAAAEDPYDGHTVLPDDDTGFRLRFVPTSADPQGAHQFHFDLTSSSYDDQQATVERALGLGASHLDVGQLPEEGHVVLADPEGNPFCVLEPGNSFLADCGFLGALSGDGSQECGYFWSEALGFPLVWDQDQETAVRAPHGGPKITWGGPPLSPKTGKERVHLDLATPADGDLDVEAERLVSLGALRVDIGQGEVAWVVMADPDGHEFCLYPPV